MTAISSAYIAQKWGMNGSFNDFDATATTYAGYATGTHIHYVTCVRVQMPGHGVSMQWKIAYAFDGGIDGRVLKYKITSAPEDETYIHADASTPADGTVGLTASLGYFTVNYTGVLTAGSYYYLYLWTGNGTNVYTLCTVSAKTAHDCSYVEGAASRILPGGFFAGTSIPVYITSDNPGFTHTIMWAYGAMSGTVAERTSNLNPAWFPDLAAFAYAMPNTATATVDYTCITYNGDAEIGRTDAQGPVWIPATVVPTLVAESVTVTPVSAQATVTGWGVYLQAYSRAEVTFGSGGYAGAYGSTITGFTIACAGRSVTSAPYRTDIFASPGTYSIECTVTDSRNRKASVTKEISVLPYSAPFISGDHAYRCTASGEASDAGTCLYALAKANFSGVGGRNAATLRVGYRTGTNPYTYVTLTSETAAVINAGLSLSSTYDVMLTISDELQAGPSIEMKIPTKRKAFHIKTGGQAAAFGSYATGLPDGTLYTAWNADFDGNLDVAGTVNTDGDLHVGEDLHVGGNLTVSGSMPVPGHAHGAGDITSGLLGPSRGGTGQGSLENAMTALITALGNISAEGNDRIPLYDASGGIARYITVSQLLALVPAPNSTVYDGPVYAGSAFGFSLYEGDIAAFAYTTNYLGSATDITLLINGSAPATTAYMYGGSSSVYGGGIIARGISSRYASCTGFISVNEGVVVVAGFERRDTSTMGWFCHSLNAGSVSSLTISRGGRVRIKRL